MKKVIVGLSGGVDSAVCAYLLKQQGFEVIGVFMRNWDSLINNESISNQENICPQEQDYLDAQKVAKHLDIELKRIDFIKEYWDYVFSYFLEQLKKGYTPNPDMLCNRHIKFDYFIKYAKSLDYDYIATGHYARTKNGKLYTAKDENKDQTYFLADIKKGSLDKVIFPLGNYTKDEIRKIALDINLPVATKKDSTGICFIGERNYQKFISNYLTSNPGNIIDIETKKIIAQHTGLMNYTIGQRRNVGISGNNDRHYVCGKNVQKNELYIAYGNSDYLYSDMCTLENVNLLTDLLPTNVEVKFRYRGEYVKATLEYQENTIIVRYDGMAKAVTPGQACVIYYKGECIGCGFIKKIFKEKQPLWYISC